jgi:hypothetical protein
MVGRRNKIFSIKTPKRTAEFFHDSTEEKNLLDISAIREPVPLESYPRFLFKRFNFPIILAGLLFEDYRTPPK